MVVDVSPRGRLAARGKGGDGDGSAKLRGRVVDDDDDDADVEAEEEKEEQEEGGATDAAKAAEREARKKAAKEEKDAKDAAAATAEAERAYQSGGDGYVFRSIQSANNETGSVYIGRHRLEEGAPVRLHVRDTAWGKQRACALMKSFGEGRRGAKRRHAFRRARRRQVRSRGRLSRPHDPPRHPILSNRIARFTHADQSRSMTTPQGQIRGRGDVHVRQRRSAPRRGFPRTREGRSRRRRVHRGRAGPGARGEAVVSALAHVRRGIVLGQEARQGDDVT